MTNCELQDCVRAALAAIENMPTYNDPILAVEVQAEVLRIVQALLESEANDDSNSKT